MAKYVKRGVKRRHNIIQGILPLLEYLAKIEGVKKVIPAKISYSPTRGIEQPTIKFQRDTISGFKLIAHGRGAIQEIFISVDGPKKNDIRYKLRDMIENNEKNNEKNDEKKDEKNDKRECMMPE